MKEQVSEKLARLYDRVAGTGILDRPRSRRAYESAYLAYKQLIEAGPIDSLREVASRGSTVIDVGANIGFFSVRFGEWVGPQGRVIAIEPEGRNVDSLRRRISRAGLADVVTVIHAAAADRSGQLRLELNPGHPGDHRLGEHGELVSAVTLDEVAPHDGRPITLVKIDVQGAETMVLTGARRVIEQHRPALFIEIHEPSLARLGSSRGELINTVAGLGYRGHKLTRRGIGPAEAPDSLIAQSATGYIDVLFLPSGSGVSDGQA